jgi:hypothetical protein
VGSIFYGQRPSARSAYEQSSHSRWKVFGYVYVPSSGESPAYATSCPSRLWMGIAIRFVHDPLAGEVPYPEMCHGRLAEPEGVGEERVCRVEVLERKRERFVLHGRRNRLHRIVCGRRFRLG